jgi:hypothetical protein
MTAYQAGHFGGYCEDPLTPALSPRGEGVRLCPLRGRSLSPWGEGQGEGGFVIQPGDMA